MLDFDERTCLRIREGDPTALSDLLTRDHSVADLFARAIAREEPGDSVALAWERLIDFVAKGQVHRALRAALLERVIEVLDETGQLETTEMAPRGTDQASRFLPADDPWAGWWAKEPAGWAAGILLTNDQVLRALRRVPPGLRTLLVLRDAARLSAAEAGPIVGRDPDRQAALLAMARDAYVIAMDIEIGN